MKNYDVLKDAPRKQPQLKMVCWLDHCSTGKGWKNLEDVVALEPMKMYTVGHVVKETNGYVTLVSTGQRSIPYGAVMGDICISKRDILKTWNLKDPSL